MSNRHCLRKKTFKHIIFSSLSEVKCQYCEKEITKQDSTIDHFYPLARGGEDKMSNYRISCLKCNQTKSDDIYTFDPGCLLTYSEIQLLEVVGHDLIRRIYEKNIIQGVRNERPRTVLSR